MEFDNASALATLNKAMDILADSISLTQPVQWLRTIEDIRCVAHHYGCSTIAMVASALESEIAQDGSVRIMTCYMEAMADAFDIDFADSALQPLTPLRQNQEALLASLALRMHG